MKIPKLPNISVPNNMHVPTTIELFRDNFDNIQMPEIEPVVNIPEVLAETYKPIIDNQNETINQLKKLYEQKEIECKKREKELIKSKKYNKIMLAITLTSMLVGVCSLMVTIIKNYKG